MRFLARHTGWVSIASLLLCVSCASPPHKEMDQAQGAIDAARAAGAERYAPTEYAAAQNALKQADAAVAARDFRLALNHALVSREQAQNAARAAGDTRARLRGDVERSMAEVKALIASTRSRLAGASGTRIPRRSRQTARQRLDQAESDLQKAVAALSEEDYTGAERLLTGIKDRLQSVVSMLSRGPTSQSSRRRT